MLSHLRIAWLRTVAAVRETRRGERRPCFAQRRKKPQSSQSLFIHIATPPSDRPSPRGALPRNRPPDPLLPGALRRPRTSSGRSRSRQTTGSTSIESARSPLQARLQHPTRREPRLGQPPASTHLFFRRRAPFAIQSRECAGLRRKT